MAIRETSSDLTAVIAALQAQVEALQAQTVTQEQQLDGLRSQFSAAERRRQARRWRSGLPLLSLLGIIVLSLLFLPTTRAQAPNPLPDKTAAQPNPDQSDVTAATSEDKIASPNTTGNPLLLGANNYATAVGDKTSWGNISPTQLMPLTLRVNNASDVDISTGLLAGRSIAILGSSSGVDPQNTSHVGVMGVSDNAQGVYGYTTADALAAIVAVSSGASGTGIYAQALGTTEGWGIEAIGGAYGGVFTGNRAPIRLASGASNGAPGTGLHYRGELYVSADGHLYFCRAGGAPGTWVRLDLDTTFVPLVQK
jgi:hypothetical protein